MFDKGEILKNAFLHAKLTEYYYDAIGDTTNSKKHRQIAQHIARLFHKHIENEKKRHRGKRAR